MLARERLQEGKVPTTPTTASIIAAVQTQEALKILHDIPVEAGRGFVFNGLTNCAYKVTYPRQEDCLEHDSGYESIEEVPWATAARTTANELLALARERLGPGAHLEFDYELVTELSCPRCGRTEAILTPLRRLDTERTRCPDCGMSRLGATSHIITGEESFAERPLDELGVPPLHIVSARCGQRYVFLELTGDASSYARWMRKAGR
jgi:adenylyltransferase/sulfurtransferase